MKRNAIFASLLILAAVVVSAQQSQPPDLSAGIVAQAAYKGWLESQNAALWLAVTQQQAATASLPQDEAAIASLQQRVTALEAALAALQGPPAPPTTVTVDLTAFPPGLLSGVASNIQWNSGQWTATGQGVAPAILGASRNFVPPAGMTLVSLTVQCMTSSCVVKLVDGLNGQTLTSPSLPPGSATTLQTGWTKPSGAITVSTPVSPATDLRLVSLSWN